MKFIGLLIPPLVQNMDKVVCANCKFYENMITYFDVEHGDHRHVGRCVRFGERSYIIGDIEYKLASIRRQDSNLCTVKGLYYIQQSDPDKII